MEKAVKMARSCPFSGWVNTGHARTAIIDYVSNGVMGKECGSMKVIEVFKKNCQDEESVTLPGES